MVAVLLCAALGAALSFPAAALSSRSARSGQVEVIGQDGTAVYAHRATSSAVLAHLLAGNEVRVSARYKEWDSIGFWGGLSGFVQSARLVQKAPTARPSTYVAPVIKAPIRAAGPFALHVQAIVAAPCTVIFPDGRTSPLFPGQRVAVTGWKGDVGGRIWYAVWGGWAPAQNLVLSQARPEEALGPHGPLWRIVAGKGMWLTLGPVTSSSPRAIVRAAQADGITHLYVESAISPLGFHGRHAVGPLLDAAHAAGITVVAWVYPYLQDVASDVELTREVAAYRTRAGNGFDGIAADLERNVQVGNTRVYSQLVRADLGPGYLLVGVTYPPGDLPGYPFAEVTRTYNVIAPMDYWHQTQTPYGLRYNHMRYGYAYGYRYALDTIGAIRAVDSQAHVAPIGQTFDDFGRFEIGSHAPSAAEEKGFIAGTREARASGVSFFEWMSATYAEWQVIRALKF